MATINAKLLSSLRPTKRFSQHKQGSAATSADFDDAGEWCLTSGADDTMQLYDCRTGRHSRTLFSKKYGVCLAKFTHNNNNAIFASNCKTDDTIRYLSLHDNQFVRYFRGHKKQVVSLNISPVDDSIISASIDGTVRLWNLKSPNCQGLLHIGSPSLACFDPNGIIFAVANHSHSKIYLYDLRNYDKEPFDTFAINDTAFLQQISYPPAMPTWTSLEISNSGKHILLGTSGEVHYVIDAFSGAIKNRLTDCKSSDPQAIFSGNICFAPDAQNILVGSGDDKLQLYDISSSTDTNLRPYEKLDCPAGSAPRFVKFNPRYAQVAACDNQLVQICPVSWKLDQRLSQCLVAVAPIGGGIAVLERDFAVAHLSTQAASHPSLQQPRSRTQPLRFISNSGDIINTFSTPGSRVAGLGINDQEQATIVYTDGLARSYDFSGQIGEIDLGEEAQLYGVASCRFYESGFAVLLGNGSFILNASITTTRIVPLAQNIPEEHRAILISHAQQWHLIGPPDSISGAASTVKVAALANSSLYFIDAQIQRCVEFGEELYHQVCFSNSANFVALLDESGNMSVWNGDLTKQFAKFVTKVGTIEETLWVGEDCIAIKEPKIVRLVGPDGAQIIYDTGDSTVVFSEIDGMRILSEKSCDFVRKVPPELENMYKIGSTARTAILLDCAYQLSQRSIQAEENIQLLGSNLRGAIMDCIQCALLELHEEWQKYILKAVSFGKIFLHIFESDQFVDACRIIRVMNQVRDSSVGIAITWPQMIHLKPKGLLQRLMNRRMHFLALKIARYLHMSTLHIYMDWAEKMLRDWDGTESELFEMIRKKLKNESGVAYDALAMKTKNFGKIQAAELLLELELRPSRQVPLLLEMRRFEQALKNAVESGDSDLVLLAILKLRKRLSIDKFFLLLRRVPESLKFTEAYAIENDLELLRELYFQNDDVSQYTTIEYKLALAKSDGQDASAIRKVRKLFQESQDTGYEASQLSRQCKLINVQKSLSRELDQTFTGLKLRRTLEKLIEMGELSRAESLRIDMEVPEKLWWWIYMQTLISKRDFRTLDIWLRSTKKSLIGYEPLVRELIRTENPREAAKYISNCTELNPAERSDLYVECGDHRSAGLEAFKAKDAQRLREIREHSTGADYNYLGDLLQKL